MLEQLQNHLQLTWIYQDGEKLTAKNQDSEAKKAEIVIPPSSELVALYQAAQRCDVADIQTEIHRIKQLDTKYIAFANLVLALVDEFEVEAIAKFVEAHL